jgi:hypothetical protein
MKPKSNCTLVEPKRLVNGQLVAGKRKPVSRAWAARYLMSCRKVGASVQQLTAGCYTLLPVGLQHGFKLLTR